MKKWYQSKTVLVNTLVLGAGLLAVLVDTSWIMANPEASAALLSVVGVVNLLLRLFTSKAIG